MQQLSCIAIVCVSIIISSSSTRAQDLPQRVPEVVVTGRGEVRIAPDRAVVFATVVTNRNTATEAASANARIVAETMSRLSAAGANAAQITNSGYALGQDFENGDRRRPRGFSARNTIRIEVPTVDNVGKVIDAALAGGATEIAPIQFGGPNMPDARRNALRMAVAEARREAEVLAEASGGTLGRLISVTSGAQPYYPQSEAAFAISSSSGNVAGFPITIRPNEVVIAAVASVRWEFVPKR